eukprot:4341834-Alexandrium_andersonii.AAC.1
MPVHGLMPSSQVCSASTRWGGSLRPISSPPGGESLSPGQFTTKCRVGDARSPCNPHSTTTDSVPADLCESRLFVPLSCAGTQVPKMKTSQRPRP